MHPSEPPSHGPSLLSCMCWHNSAAPSRRCRSDPETFRTEDQACRHVCLLLEGWRDERTQLQCTRRVAAHIFPAECLRGWLAWFGHGVALPFLLFGPALQVELRCESPEMHSPSTHDRSCSLLSSRACRQAGVTLSTRSRGSKCCAGSAPSEVSQTRLWDQGYAIDASSHCRCTYRAGVGLIGLRFSERAIRTCAHSGKNSVCRSHGRPQVRPEKKNRIA